MEYDGDAISESEWYNAEEYPIESDPSEADLKHLLSRTAPYLKCALVEAEIRHDQTLDLCFYERVKDLSDLLDKIEAAIKE